MDSGCKWVGCELVRRSVHDVRRTDLVVEMKYRPEEGRFHPSINGIVSYAEAKVIRALHTSHLTYRLGHGVPVNIQIDVSRFRLEAWVHRHRHNMCCLTCCANYSALHHLENAFLHNTQAQNSHPKKKNTQTLAAASMRAEVAAISVSEYILG